MLSWIMANSTYILAFLFALSELLAQIPSIKANSVFQLFVNAIKALGPAK